MIDPKGDQVKKFFIRESSKRWAGFHVVFLKVNMGKIEKFAKRNLFKRLGFGFWYS